jgi:CheY-like chemotaxis protein
LLVDEGCHVKGASNGKEALAVSKDMGNRPCLILLDLMMPVMNGWEFLEQRTGTVSLASIPVAVLSAITDRSKIPEANDYLRKPIKLDALLEVVEAYCR